jgi:SAM-dependent methyltransferase
MTLLTPRLITKLEYFVQGVASYAQTPACPHCRGVEHALVARKYRVVRVLRCRSCGLLFTHPIYRSRLARDFYDAMYEAEGSTTALPTDVELVALESSGFAGSDKDASVRLERIVRIVGAPHGQRLLELGSSWGYFLAQAVRVGFRATGIEIGTRRREFGVSRLGLDIVPSIDEVERGAFDVTYTAHVLEHFTDVSEIFDRLAGCLRRDGHLFIEVPNVDLEAVGPRALDWIGAVHPLGYDSAFFSENLARHGLRVAGLYDDWSALPDRSVQRSSSPVVIVHARRADD